MESIPLFENDRLAVIKSYGKTEADIKFAVQHLSEWAQKQHHLPQVPEWKLEVFYIHCKCIIEKTKRRVDLYYSVRNMEPKLFSDWDPLSEELQTAASRISFVLLPKYTKDLHQVGIGKFYSSDTENYSPLTYLKIGYMCTEMQLPFFHFKGHHMIYDLKGLTLSHCVKFTPTIVQQAKMIATKVYPYRFKGVHFLNSDSTLDFILRALRPWLKAELFTRIHIHSDLESLYKIIPREILPRDYGGDEVPYMELHNRWIDEAVRMKPFFAEELNYKTDESKRIGDSYAQDIFGSMEGSFRKLEVD